MGAEPQQPSGVIELLVREAAGTSTGNDLAEWAVQALTDGFDSAALRKLAGLDIGTSCSWFEAKPLFDQAVEELGLALPLSKEAILRTYLHIVAREVLSNTRPATEALEVIHREVLTPLNHPADLMAWCHLWEGLEPSSFTRLDDSAVEDATRELARTMLKREGAA